MDTTEAVGLDVERAALVRIRTAVQAKLERFSGISGGGADQLAQDYIDAVVADTIDQLRQELVVFGRIDDEQTWRIGVYGIDTDGEQLVVDWRAPFARAFYQARLDDPHELRRRISYVGSIDDLLIEDFSTGEVAGSSPLLAELSRTKGSRMRSAVATLQSEQDELVRLAPEATLVLRGGPGTGKTVVGLHRAAWLVYNDRRITGERILVLGPSDRFLRYVAAVLPTLGERKVRQSTFSELLGTQTSAGAHPGWPELLDRFEAGLVRPAPVSVRGRRIEADQIAEVAEQVGTALPWRERRRAIISRVASRRGLPVAEVGRAMAGTVPSCSTRQALAQLRRRSTLVELGAEPDLIDDWLAVESDGSVLDEVRARFEGVPARYSHVIVDEAQDLTELQLNAVRRRSTGLTLVGDDAQRSHPAGLGLVEAARRLGVELRQMDTAYRQSAEIVDWCNRLAARHPELGAVKLVGLRPTGVPVSEAPGADSAALVAELGRRWSTVADIGAGEVWEHQGIEYDAVVVRTSGLDPRDLYLAASRAAHELVLV